MNIPEFFSKIKVVGRRIEEAPLFISLVIILVALASFGLGRLSLLEEKRTPVVIEQSAEKVFEENIGFEMVNAIVASKNGTRYYYPWCEGISRISAKNKISFSGKDEAEKAGYSLASGCPAP